MGKPYHAGFPDLQATPSGPAPIPFHQQALGTGGAAVAGDHRHRSINEASRRDAQRWLAQRIGADLGSISGEHLGRLAGFKNWKRGGVWTNVVASSLQGKRWDPSAVPSPPSAETATPPARQRWHKTTDTSPSGRE